MKMNKQYHLIVPIENFIKQIGDKALKANEMYKTTIIKTSEELNVFMQNKKEWFDESLTILKSSFDEPVNKYSEMFRFTNRVPYRIPGTQEKLDISDELRDLGYKQRSLCRILGLIKISDLAIRPDSIDLSVRSHYTIEEKLDLLLDKLYDVYDELYYPVKLILEDNGIILKRDEEHREFAEILKEKGYAKIEWIQYDMYDPSEIGLSLTLPGAMYVEGKRKIYKESYEDISESQEEINTRIDEIIKQLTKLGLGQEIIFDEIQELKELYPKVNNKTWGQIVKGKLIDLALAKLIENDTLKFIYKALTNHEMRLL